MVIQFSFSCSGAYENMHCELRDPWFQTPLHQELVIFNEAVNFSLSAYIHPLDEGLTEPVCMNHFDRDEKH